MRFITGDLVGLVKIVNFDESSSVPNPSKKLKPSSITAEPPTKPLTFGSINRARAIDCMNWHKPSKRQVVLGRRDGSVELVGLDGVFSDSFLHYVGKVDENGVALLNKHKKAEHFVGVDAFERLVVSCTDTGIVTYRKLKGCKSKLPDVSVSLSQTDICVMKVHPTNPHIFATGGDERELCIWDIKKYKDGEKFEPIWKAKNVKNDKLDLRVQVWVTCILWMNNDTTEIATGTGYHQIRTYNTSVQKRPLLDFTIGTHPVRSLVLSQNGEYISSDTLGNVSGIDAKNGQLLGRYRGIAGAVTDLYSSSLHPFVVTVSADRKLRVFEERDQRRLVKEQLSCVLVEENLVEEEGDVWDGIPTADEPALVEPLKSTKVKTVQVASKKRKVTK